MPYGAPDATDEGSGSVTLPTGLHLCLVMTWWMFEDTLGKIIREWS